MQVVLTLLFIFALCSGVAAIALSIYNFARMIPEIRSSSSWWVNLIPFVSLAMPNALTPEGEIYRSRFSRWLGIAALLVAIAGGARLGAEI